MLKLSVDDIAVEVPAGATILQAAQAAGVKIPTLCHTPGLQSPGSCRVCLVEVEGARTLVASCVAPAAAGMKIRTTSAKVRQNRRMVVELLLSDHEGDCQTCDRNDDCELQSIARSLGIREVSFPGAKSRKHADASTPALTRDTGKCILCRRCVTVCNQIQGVAALFPQNRGFDTVIGPAFCNELNDVVCVQCGQCGAVCPVGAISERDQIGEVWAALDDPNKHVVVQTAPAIRAALGECFGMEPGSLVTGKMITALRRLGFDAVFDTNFAADLTIMEEGTELLARLKKALAGEASQAGNGSGNGDHHAPAALPMFTSCSPGWIKFMEHYYPDMLDNLSTCKSPQQMFGAVAKSYYAEKVGKKPEDVFVVSIMPCTAKKYESQRPEMNASGGEGRRDVDVVLTTRELGRMIEQAGIDFVSLPDGKMDSPMGESTGAADIFANTGGVMEAALRTAYEIVAGKELPFDNLHVTPVAGLEGIKEASITITDTTPEWSLLKGATLKVAVAHGLANARRLIEEIRAGRAEYHFIEVMTCPGGCIGGGGQPRMTDDSVRKARIAAIYREDEGKPLRKSHANPSIKRLYDEFLGAPLGEKSHELLHTHYTERGRV